MKNDRALAIIKDRLEFPVTSANLRQREEAGTALSLLEESLNHYPSDGILTGFTEYLPKWILTIIDILIE